LPLGQELLLQDKTEWKKEFGDAIGKCDEIQGELEKIKQQFNDECTKAVALRDGVSVCNRDSGYFWHYAVILRKRCHGVASLDTSRGECEALDLCQHLLLTIGVLHGMILSILNDPLDWSEQSIWSTTDTFGYHNLSYKMAAIGVLTYLIVFNLNQIVKLGKTNYLSLKHGMVDKMQADERESGARMRAVP
jgi:hypothetical protein